MKSINVYNIAAGTDSLRKLLLAKAVQCSLEKITVHLLPSVDKFEENLCRLLVEEYLRHENIQTSGTGGQVMKRYLKVFMRLIPVKYHTL